MLWLAVLLHWICAGLFLKTSCNKQHDGIYYVNGLTCYIVLFNYAMVGDGGFTQVFFLTRWYLCKWFNLLHGVVLVLFWCCFNYAMLSGTTLRYWICTGLFVFFVLFFFVCVTTFWGWMQAGVYINALSMARPL